MNIQHSLDEIDKIKDEIRRNNNKNAVLRNRIKSIERTLHEYFEHKKSNGLKYNNQVITIEQKVKRKQKPKKIKDQEISRLMDEFGIRDVEVFKNRLDNIQKGDEKIVQQVKYKKIKPVK